MEELSRASKEGKGEIQLEKEIEQVAKQSQGKTNNQKTWGNYALLAYKFISQSGRCKNS